MDIREGLQVVLQAEPPVLGVDRLDERLLNLSGGLEDQQISIVQTCQHVGHQVVPGSVKHLLQVRRILQSRIVERLDRHAHVGVGPRNGHRGDLSQQSLWHCVEPRPGAVVEDLQNLRRIVITEMNWLRLKR